MILVKSWDKFDVHSYKVICKQTNKHGKTTVFNWEPQDPITVIWLAPKTEYPLEIVEWNQTQLKVSENSSAINP
jgi:hypothetical protein